MFQEKPSVVKQIEKDLLRTIPNNVCFESLQSVGIPKLRRILRALAYLYPEIGEELFELSVFVLDR